MVLGGGAEPETPVKKSKLGETSGISSEGVSGRSQRRTSGRAGQHKVVHFNSDFALEESELNDGVVARLHDVGINFEVRRGAARPTLPRRSTAVPTISLFPRAPDPSNLELPEPKHRKQLNLACFFSWPHA